MRRILGIAVLAALMLSVLCLGGVDDGLRIHMDSVRRIVELLDQGERDAALDLLDDLHHAIIVARAELTGLMFQGHSESVVTDPFFLPDGTYRVHFTTEGFGAVKILVLEGSGGDQLLFNVFPGGAAEGASKLYRSPGNRIVVQFWNITDPFELIFERIDS
jgi:hypothetical protein